ALREVIAANKFPEYRQGTVLDRQGGTGHHSGATVLGTGAVPGGGDCLGAGNLRWNREVPGAMARAFGEDPTLHLAERLLRGLEAGPRRGGGMGGGDLAG